MEVEWRANTDVPAPGTRGTAYPADGHHDPASAAYEAYVFYPEGDEDGYYCGIEDVRPLPPEERRSP